MLHEGLTVLAAGADDPDTALRCAKGAGLTHPNLDGTVVRTDRVGAAGPNGTDLWWSAKHEHHGGKVQVISAPTAGRSGSHRSARAASTTPPAPVTTA